jgi:Sulfotransferase family
MSRFTRRILRYAHESLTEVNVGIEHRLNGGRAAHRTPFIAGLEQGYATGWSHCPCVFVLSTGRVGTKTLAALMALSPHVMATHEPEPRLIKASFDAYMEGGDIGDSINWRALVLAARDDAVCAANRRGRIYVETAPKLTFLARAFAVSFPASRFIHLHRHPYAVVRSCLQRGHYQGHNWDFARIRPRPGEPLADTWASLPPLDKNAWRWAHVNAYARDFFSTLPESRKLAVRADALFAGNEMVLKELFAFVGLEVPPMEWIEEVLGRKINARPKRVVPPSQQWSEKDRKAVWHIVAEVAQCLGYEP